MPLRLLFYVSSVWKRWLVDHSNEEFAPPVIAMVLHHSRTGWRAAPELASVFSPETQRLVGSLLPTFRFILDDISHATADELAHRAGHALAVLCLLAFWSIRDRQKLIEAMPYIEQALVELPGTPEHRDALVRLWRYFFLASPEGLDDEELRSMLLKVAGPKFAEDVMNAGQQLINRGLEQGRAEGQAKGLREAIIRVFLARGLSLSQLGQARIESCDDVALLMAWVERAVTVSSETELFA